MARIPSAAGGIPVASVVLVACLAVGLAGAVQHSALSVGREQPGRPRGSFTITSAKLRHPLRPGTSQALDLRLTNLRGSSLDITKLNVVVVVDRAHARAGCDGRRDFRVVGLPPSSYPLRLRPRRTVSLRRLRVRALPRVAMVARPRNQDACKGARLTLRFGGRARRSSAGSGP